MEGGQGGGEKLIRQGPMGGKLKWDPADARKVRLEKGDNKPREKGVGGWLKKLTYNKFRLWAKFKSGEKKLGPAPLY